MHLRAVARKFAGSVVRVAALSADSWREGGRERGMEEKRESQPFF